MFCLSNANTRELSIKTEQVIGDDRAFIVRISRDGRVTKEFEVLAMRTIDELPQQHTNMTTNQVCEAALPS